VGATRLARSRAAIPVGEVAPVGLPATRSTAAGERARRRTKRQERERTIGRAILDFLRCNGAQSRSAIRRHLVGVLGACSDLTVRSRLHALVLASQIEMVSAVAAASGESAASRVLYAWPSWPLIGTSVLVHFCGCTPRDPCHEGRTGTVVAKRVHDDAIHFAVQLSGGVVCVPLAAAVT
jgi:hypothetical protein